MDLLTKIRDKAKKLNKRIVLPEGLEDRTVAAADQVLKEGIARIILLGDTIKIQEKAKATGLTNIERATLVNPLNHPKKEQYIDLMVELRKHKGLTREEAARQVENPLYLGTIMIKNGDADGEIAGAMNATGDVLRPAFQFVKTMPGITIVSGAFIMIVPDKKFGDDGILVFADCAVHPDPDARQLAEIAVATSYTARNIAGIEPKIAMLCFSTKGSASHAMVDKVVTATSIVREMAPQLQVDGELQADAALIESIGLKKAPGSPIAGKANVLIFPDLNSGNIASFYRFIGIV